MAFRRLLYGLSYDKTKNRWERDPAKAAVVRRIFEMCAEGASTIRITEALNADGVPAPRSKRWTRSTVGYYLRHRGFLGTLTKTVGGETFEIPVPQIVPDELWQRAQATLDANWQRPRRKNYRHEALCRGRIYCGTCSRRMHVAVPERKEKGPILYYRCASYHSNNNYERCGSGYHRLLEVDDEVWGLLAERLRDPAMLLEAAQVGEGDIDSESWETKAADCEKALERLQRQEVETLRHADVASPEAIRVRMEEIAADRRTQETDLQVARQAIAQQALLRSSMQSLAERVEQIRENLEATSFRERRTFVKAVIPPSLPYGVKVHEDGRLEVTGLLDISPASGSAAAGGAGPGARGGDDASDGSSMLSGIEPGSGALVGKASDFTSRTGCTWPSGPAWESCAAPTGWWAAAST